MTKAAAKIRRAEKEDEINAVGAPVKRDRMSLGQFMPFYLERRARGDTEKIRRTSKEYGKLSPGALAGHDMCLRYMIEHWGEGKRLDEIDLLAADEWYDALENGKLKGARSGGWGKDRDLSTNSLRNKIREARSIFGWAKSRGLIKHSPVDGWSGASVPGERPPHVTAETVALVCQHAPVPYRAFLGLCRLAGLRKAEAVELRWSGEVVDGAGVVRQVGIDWGGKAIRLVAGKTGSYRVVPIVAALMPILTDAFDQAAEGVERVVQPVTMHNLERPLAKCCKAAGVPIWKQPFKALRASRENDWKESGVAAPTYCEWLGHSEDVSRKHYLGSTVTEFQAAIDGT